MDAADAENSLSPESGVNPRRNESLFAKLRQRMSLKPSLAKYVERIQQGDQSAFLPLYENTAPGLMRFLMWKTNGDKPLSEDILQESFVRFLLNVDRLESLDQISIHSYLLRIVKNCLIDKVGRAPMAARGSVPLEAVGEMPDTMAMNRQERAVELRELNVAMQKLTDKDSQIVWLRDVLGYSHKEVADEVGISEQASRQAYVRAKRTLVDYLKSQWMDGEETGGLHAISPTA